MAGENFAKTWRRSKQVRKQRKYRYNAPLHLKQKMLAVHLSSDLRKKYNLRRIQVRTGDKVKILRGQFAKKEGKVERVSLKKEKVYLTGIEMIKKDGTKIQFPLTPSNLMIVELDLSDKKRKQKLESSGSGKSNGKNVKNISKKEPEGKDKVNPEKVKEEANK